MRAGLEQALMDELRSDGRATYSRLAATVGAPISTVRARVSGLISRGLVRVSVLVHPQALYRAIELYLRIRVDENPDGAREPEMLLPVTWLARVLGRSDLIATIRVSSLTDASTWISRLGSEPWVVSVESTVSLAGYIGRHAAEEAVAGDGDWPDLESDALDEVDFALIRHLQRDGRASYASLARTAQMSVPAARRRVLRLFAMGAVRVWTSFRTPGQEQCHAALRLQVRAGEETRLIAAMVDMPGVATVNRVTGIYSLDVSLHADTQAEMDGVAGAVAALGGILASEFQLLDVISLNTVPEVGEV